MLEEFVGQLNEELQARIHRELELARNEFIKGMPDAHAIASYESRAEALSSFRNYINEVATDLLPGYGDVVHYARD